MKSKHPVKYTGSYSSKGEFESFINNMTLKMKVKVTGFRTRPRTWWKLFVYQISCKNMDWFKSYRVHKKSHRRRRTTTTDDDDADDDDDDDDDEDG